MTRAGVLFTLTFVAALAATIMAAPMADAAGPSRNAPALERRGGAVGSYNWEAGTLEWHLIAAASTLHFENFVGAAEARSKRRYRGIGRADSSWSPRIGEGNRLDSPAWHLGDAPFNMETLPVTILGRRIVLSHFTVNRRGVRGMLSTAF